MPEAITKYAVNSSLGTNDFIPIDKLINKNYENSYRVVSSSELLYSSSYTFSANATDYPNKIVHIPKTLKITKAGTIKISFDVAVYSYLDITVSIRKNGETVYSSGKITGVGEANNISQIIDVLPNDIISFTISLVEENIGSDMRLKFNNIKIYGTIVHNIVEEIDL